MLPEHAVCLVVKPGLMTELNGCGSGQRQQQGVEQRNLLLSRRWELEQHRAEALAEDRDALGEDPREADLVECLGAVGQAAVRLHAEPENGRGRGRPSLQRGLGRRAVEAAGELDAAKSLRL